MRIDVSSIKFDIGAVKDVNVDVKVDDLKLRTRIIELPEPLHLELQVTNTGDKYLLMGNMHVHSVVDCNRCLEKFAYPMDIQFFEEFDKAGMENDNLLDITDAIYEHIMLDLPIKTLCDANCKGLCSRCGQNLNEKECGCDREVIDPRLIKLKELFNKD